MARIYARIYGSIWQDPDFSTLPALTQRTYILALSQPGLSLCGVVGYTARRWAAMAPDTTERAIVKTVRALECRGYLAVDENTEELWVRSFVRHDGVLESPNLVKGMWKDLGHVFSPYLRDLALYEIPEEFWEGDYEEYANGFGKPSENPSPNPTPNPETYIPKPRARRGSRIPEEFQVTPEMVEWIDRECPSIDWRHHTKRFVNYWKSIPGQRGVKLDWVRTWQNWMLKEAGG